MVFCTGDGIDGGIGILSGVTLIVTVFLLSLFSLASNFFFNDAYANRIVKAKQIIPDIPAERKIIETRKEGIAYLHQWENGFKCPVDKHKNARPVDSSFSFNFPSIAAAVEPCDEILHQIEK